MIYVGPNTGLGAVRRRSSRSSGITTTTCTSGSAPSPLEFAVDALEPLTDEQREIRDLVRTLTRERIAPRAAEIDASAEFPWDMVELLREHELFGLAFEERHGGSGAGALMLLVAVEEVSRACATTGLILAVQELGSLALKLAGTDEQKDRYLPELASGEWIGRVRADGGRLGLGLGSDAH